jgi:hypothetical protein
MEALVLLGALAVVLGLYFLPSFVAGHRRHPSGGAVIILNLLLGWTLLGWVVALVWAMTGEAGSAVPPTKCPHCAELIKAEAKVCKHCGRDLPAAPASSPVEIY